MPPPRVHVLGLGSIGTFAAHVLAEARPRPEITLLLHRANLLDDYARNGSCISLQSHTGDRSRQTGYRFEVMNKDRKNAWYQTRMEPQPSEQKLVVDTSVEASDPIDNLVVAVKSWQTVGALAPLKHRLHTASTVAFIQNGSGMLEAVNENLFQDPKSRPRYVMGITTQCINLLSPFSVEHSAPGFTSMGMVPRQDKGEESCYLTDVFASVPRINSTTYPYPDLFQKQLEKLTINAVNNPICALADAQNEHLWTCRPYWLELVREISAVCLKLPELKGVPGVEERFSVERLEEVVLNNLRLVEKATCSMRWDLRARRKTEVEFINGYWVRRGRELGVQTPVNKELVRRVREREDAWK